MSRGRSTRASLGSSIYADEFNVMEDHFNSETNSYQAGQLKYDRQRKSDGSSTKLHVVNIPLDMTDQGLLNVFIAEGGKPLHAFVGKGKAGGSHTWGMVEFQTLSEAQAAITAVHRKPPHNLGVKFALTDEQKQERDKNKNEAHDSDSDKYSSITMTRGRGHLPPMKGKPPNSIRSSRPQDEEFYDEPKGFGTTNYKFSHPDTTYEVNASNSVYSPFADGYYDNGNRKISMGRGTFINKEQQDSISSTSASVSREKFAFEEVTDEMDMKVSAYISKRFKQLSCEENFKLSSEMSLSLPFKLGQCAYCSRPSIYCCSRCKEWYCCNSCRFDDYPMHKKTCVPRTITFDKDGNISYSNVPDEFADAEETPTLVNYSPKDGRLLSHEQSTTKGFQKQSSARISGGFNESNGFADHSYDSNKLSDLGSHAGNHNDRSQRGDTNRGNRDHQKDSIRDQQKGRGPRNSMENNEKNKGSGNRPSRGGGRATRNDKRGSRVHESQPAENEVYVRPPISPPENMSGRIQEKKMPPPVSEVQPPIPIDKFTEVTVGSIGINNEFIAYSSLDSKKQIEIMRTLNDFCPNATPLAGRLDVGLKVSAPFTDGWFRAEIIKFIQSKVEVYFVDFGNIATLEKKDLRPLPADLTSIPNLAHKYKLAHGSAKNIELAEEMSINIKPISQDRDGRWIVHVEGVKYEEIQELKDGVLLCEALPKSDTGGHSENAVAKHLLYSVTKGTTAGIYVEKVMNEDFLTGCIIPTGGTPHFMEVSNILEKEVVKTETFRLTKGMMVAAYWDKKWYRGYVMLIRDKDPMIALVDRGTVVIPQAVAPLPEKMYKIPESGIRAIFKDPIVNLTMNGKYIPTRILRLDGDKVRIEAENIGPAVLVPWEPTIEEAGLNSIRLESGTKVVISSYVSPSAFYVHSNQPKDLVIRAELMQDLAAHALQCDPLKRRPLCGEFLAVRFTEDGNYYRAQITSRNEDKYTVTFIDYGNTDTVTIADMKPLPDNLKIVPCCAVKVGLKGVPNVPFNPHCMKYLNELCGNSEELFISFENGLNDVILKTCDGQVINKVLAELLTPSWEQPQYNPLAGQVFLKNDLVYEDWEKGDSFECAVIRAVSVEEILVVRTNSDLLVHIESNLTPAITKYCEELPNETYNPRPNEICLAKFHEDENWYRAICLKSFPHNASQIFYIDYGNSGQVLHRCIRKMVPDFMETPVALKSCKVYGLPPRLSDGIKKKLFEWYSNCNKLEATVIDFKTETPVLWIPALQDAAKEMGFHLRSP